MVFKVGLTGGIGSGKTVACKKFSELGVPIIDADIISHEIVQPGMPALLAIKDKFGNDAVDARGHLDRNYLRSTVFTNKKLRKVLEDILHPIVIEEIKNQCEKITNGYCIIAIPLLIEKNLQNLVDRVLVIDTSESLQIERSSKRDNVDADNIQDIIDSQCPRDERLAAADDIISNDDDIQYLHSQIDKLHSVYSRY